MFTQSATNLSYLCSLYRFHRHLYPRVHLYSYTHHPCPQHEHKQRTNERTNTERERNVVVGATADILGFRLRPLLRVSSGRARSDGEGKNRLSTGPRFVESHLANSVNVVRRRRRRRSLPCPTRSLLHRGRATSEQACSLWSRRTNRGTPPRRRFIATTALR